MLTKLESVKQEALDLLRRRIAGDNISTDQLIYFLVTVVAEQVVADTKKGAKK
jgi:hypothetical protein